MKCNPLIILLKSCILFILTVSFSYSQSIFKISPYIVMEEERSASIRFWTHQKIKLDFKVEIVKGRTSRKIVASKDYTPQKLQSIDLGKIQCGELLKYTVAVSEESFIIDKNVNPFPCDPNKDLVLGFMSDTQIKNKRGSLRAKTLAKTIESLQKTVPFNFIINAGDFVQLGNDDTEWFNFFQVSKGYLDKNYFITALGNHEYYKKKDGVLLEVKPKDFMTYMRSDKSSSLGNMAIGFKEFQILVLNTNFKHLSEEVIHYQWSWLRDKLELGEILNKRSIIVSHHSPYSSSLEHLRSIPTRLRKELIPILESFKNVQVMLSGHLHMYERSFKNNIHYITAGPSGGINNPITYKNKYKIFLKPFTTTFSILKISADKISIDTYDANQEIIDQLTIKNIR